MNATRNITRIQAITLWINLHHGEVFMGDWDCDPGVLEVLLALGVTEKEYGVALAESWRGQQV